MNLNILGTSYKLNPNSNFCDGLISLSKMSSKFVRVTAGARLSFLFKAEWNIYPIEYIYIYIYISYCLSIHPSVDTRAASAF